MAPELTIPGEGIGRTTGEHGRVTVAIESKEIGPTCHVGAVGAAEDGEVSDQPDAVFQGMLAKSRPLSIQHELHEGVVLGNRLSGTRATSASRSGHGVIAPVLEPGFVTGAKIGVCPAPGTSLSPGVAERIERRLEPWGLPGSDPSPGCSAAIVQSTFIRRCSQCGPGEQAVLDQIGDRSKHRFDREARERAVGGVAGADRTDRKHLPSRKSCGLHPLDEAARGRAQVADAEGPLAGGKGGRVQQDPRGPFREQGVDLHRQWFAGITSIEPRHVRRFRGSSRWVDHPRRSRRSGSLVFPGLRTPGTIRPLRSATRWLRCSRRHS